MSGIQDTYLNAGFYSRDKYIPLRSNDHHKVVSIFGLTGSGKTTLLREILGMDPKTEKIPPTSSSRTTTYNFEAVINDEKLYKACITFFPNGYLKDIITDCLFNASKKFYSDNDINKSFRVLLEDSTQTFRLKYVIGDIASDSNQLLKKKYEKILKSCMQIYSELNQILESDNTTDSKIAYENDNIIYEDLLKNEKFKQSVEQIYADIIELFNKIIAEPGIEIIYDEGVKNDGPLGCYFEVAERKMFIEKLHAFIGIQKKSWGKLITPFVESVRISGPFCPKWLASYPRVTFIDGKGVGHTTEKQSIPSFYIDLFEKSDDILIVDESIKPMQSGTTDIVKGVVKHGYHEKLIVVFSKFDLMEGDNYENNLDKIDHIQNSFRQVCENMKRNEDEYLIAKDLENIAESRFFYLPLVHSDQANGDLFGEEIQKFFSLIDNNAQFKIKKKDERKEIAHIKKVIVDAKLQQSKFNDYHTDLKDSVSKFLGKWDAILNLPSQYPAQAEHWKRIQALARRLYQFPDAFSYDSLRPIDDFIDFIQSVIFQYVRKNNLDNRHISSLSSKNKKCAIEQLKYKSNSQWKTAFERCGEGSTRERSRDIQKLYNEHAFKAMSIIEKELDIVLNKNSAS